MTAPWLDIVGVGETGVADLPDALKARIMAAERVVGPERLLAGARALGVPANRLAGWEKPLSAMLAQIERLRGTRTVILATGDPSWFGIGATLAGRLPADELAIHPAPSAFALAAARMAWPLQAVETVSLHGRPVAALLRHLYPGARILALTGDRTTLAAVKALLAGAGLGKARITVLAAMGGSAERRFDLFADAPDGRDPGDFHTLAIACPQAGPGWGFRPLVPGLPDDAFDHDGQLTKREVRAASLSRLGPYPGALLWDIGAGSGAVAIEWMRAARGARAVCFERDEGRLALIARNRMALGTPDLTIVPGPALAGLAERSDVPDAIFHGGDLDDDQLFGALWDRLKPGGRLVANAVTLAGEAALYDRQARWGGDLVRLGVETLDTIGSQRVFRPRMRVTQWSVEKTEAS